MRNLFFTMTIAVTGYLLYESFFHIEAEVLKSQNTESSMESNGDANEVKQEAKIQAAEESEETEKIPVNKVSRNDYPKRLKVTFPSGASVDVVYSLTASQTVSGPRSGALDEYIFDLMEDAKSGSAASANAVDDLLGKCAETPRSLKEFRASIQELEVSGTLTHSTGMGVEPGYAFAVGSNAHQFAVSTMRLRFESCRLISDQQIAERSKWAAEAKELGSAKALEAEARELIKTNPEEAFTIFQKLWKDGEIKYTSALQEAYLKGTAPGSNGNPNPVMAHAFHLLRNKVFEQAHYENENPHAANLAVIMDAALNTGSAGMTVEDISRAENLAETWLRENKNCCKGIWQAF